MNTMAPIRPTLQPPRRISLTARPAAAAEARNQLQAAICAWAIPVDASTAQLLTSELVNNAISHAGGDAVMLVISCAGARLRVDVYDTSPAPPVLVDAPADAETGRGLMLVAGLSEDWGYYRTPAGKAVYFTLAFEPPRDANGADPPQGVSPSRGVSTAPGARSPQGGRSPRPADRAHPASLLGTPRR